METERTESDITAWATPRFPARGLVGQRGKPKIEPRGMKPGLLICYPIARALILRRRNGRAGR